MCTKTFPTDRVQSIDALKGIDLSIIIFTDRFIYKLESAVCTPFTRALSKQFDDHEWFGSSLHDVVMPLILFVVGAAITTIGGLGTRYLLLGHV